MISSSGGCCNVFPNGHEQVVEPMGDVSPSKQSVHSNAPETDENVLIGHFVQVFEELAPTIALARPAVHLRHLSIDVDPVVERYVPLMQGVQLFGVPDDEVHVPTKHGVHSVEPIFENVPGGQERHTAKDVRSSGNGVVE